MSLFPVFKINKISDKNKTDEIYVFYGINLDISNPNDLFKQDPNNVAFSQIFDKDELDKILLHYIKI